jgi:uncharacterized membrane protein YjjP (DUF1212 family)
MQSGAMSMLILHEPKEKALRSLLTKVREYPTWLQGPTFAVSCIALALIKVITYVDIS